MALTAQEFTMQRQSLEVKVHELVECQLRLEMADTKIASLENALSVVEDKIVALRHDYLFLAQEKANLDGQIEPLRTITS